VFPPPDRWPDNDLIAVGGDLDSGTLINAYRRGVFPMEVTALQKRLGWWSPDPRGIVDVMRACGDPSREDGWITEEFVSAYTRLHQLGWAHSVEVFDREGRLAGGLYGVRVDGLFAGESMFHAQRDASKVALMALVELMRDSGMRLLDVQWCTAHLASLGSIEVPRPQYLSLLGEALTQV